MSVRTPIPDGPGRVARFGPRLTVSATVVIPFHRNLDQLRQSVAASRACLPEAELLVAADGAVEDCRPLVKAAGGRVIDVDGPSGPAVARNRAAAQARGDVLLFVDTDVVPKPESLSGLCRFLEEHPDVAGVFGAYCLEPAEPSFMSQFKNLSHRYVHEINAGEASTFWAGLGAVRASAFRAVGGFDERFGRPSIEDIELGCRLVAAGHRLVLAPAFEGTHLKRWTLASVVSTDLWARGVPWTQLIHRAGMPRNGLNLRLGLRVSVLAAYLVAASIPLVALSAWFAGTAAVGVALLLGFNAHFYQWLGVRRGSVFAVRAVGAHFVHHLCNGLSFVLGTALFYAGRRGWQLPGVLPQTSWTAPRVTRDVAYGSVGR